MKISVSRADAAWGYIGTILSMGANLLILPAVLIYLDDSMVGLYYVFTNLSSIAQLFDFGFTPSVSRSVSYAWSGAKNLQKSGAEESKMSEPNYSLILQVIHVCKMIYTLLALLAFVLGITFGTIYIKSITQDFSGYSHYAAWYLYVAAISLNLLYGYYSVFLRGVGNVKDANKATVISKCIQIVLCIILLILGFGIVGVALAYLIYGLMFRLLAKKWFYNYKDIKKSLKAAALKNNNNYNTKGILSQIWPNTWREGLVTLSEYLSNQAATVIASLYLTLYETGVYSLSIQLTTAIASISMTLFTTYQPALQSAYVNRDKNVQRNYMSLALFAYTIIFICGMTGLLIVGRPLIYLIKPTYMLSVPLLILTGAYQFILKYRNCCTSYIASTNRLIYTRAYVISSVICTVLSLLSVGIFKLGVYGLIVSQLLSQLIYNAWKWRGIVYKELNINSVQIFKNGYREAFELIMKKRKK